MKIKLEDILEILEMVNNQINGYYNPETGDIFLSDFDKFEILNEDMEELFEKLIILPTKFEINEYKIMKDFIDTIEDIQLQNQLYVTINDGGAFRRFKDTCINYGIIKDWYKFRNEKYKDIAISWCIKNNIEFE